ncbi:MAG: cupin domain-containing protein [Gaiellaceae bacterium]
MSDPQIAKIHALRGARVADGVQIKALFGDAAMLNLVELEPNASVPLHSHPHEQLGYVVSGEIVMTIAGEDHTLGPGAAYTIPGDTEHAGAAGPEGCAVLDFFHPIREDYRALIESSD